MILRAALLLASTVLLAACVSTGQVDPMKTDSGRDAARDAYINLGIGYLKQGATERAKVPLKKALEMDPSNADANAALALVFQTEMEPDLADQHYRKALSSRNDPRILNNYGTFLYEQGRYKDAYERFQQAAEDNLYPERSRVFENLGLTALKMNNPALARQHFDKALRLNRQQPLALLEMSQLAFDDKQYVPARDFYQRYSQIAPQNARSLLLGARLATIFEDRDQAASLGLQLKRLYPGTPEYQQYLSEQ
ncbi:type IV pilus biogenesis/stability protein PilW [Pseudomonas sp. JS3066]|jgi:type IV pilus assembly protein PilF|uniref:type IV pilus biogenesis/stability protein PilW n=1 Tax=unclassified Pseudomonas TaxID=196821 RepID=UPI000EA887BA|nr:MULTISPECIES: type IV pilus biogenesis/stability protein PilW [unclassified Pseudomonas]AYF88229.1 type IV pilus biogenesis/stability protein PilW [Pseudomonas sp. DY-1]MDH4654508.1 type IV pilus biogenesis/stability protein PilW [Pseudomonas sp. BN606]MRK24196.1 type IV pilus biogenesis/stability protein PilW [Pseudomonas sp. JG-B]WVK94223.1 type IV pilus biogenesis/stability protein PilW [Pseudomonas sp. JS3066]